MTTADRHRYFFISLILESSEYFATLSPKEEDSTLVLKSRHRDTSERLNIMEDAIYKEAVIRVSEKIYRL